jgi:hypothetical protein
MQAVLYSCGTIAQIIPLAIDANNPNANHVPTAVYGTFLALMCCAIILGCSVLPPEEVQRDDGTMIAEIPVMTYEEAIRGSIKCIMDWRLLLLVPGMMSTETHLVYLGVVNGKPSKVLKSSSQTNVTKDGTTTVVSVPSMASLPSYFLFRSISSSLGC